jgi:WAP-type (Whey Acidic Protein) 'four-disulfide core'
MKRMALISMFVSAGCATSTATPPTQRAQAAETCDGGAFISDTLFPDGGSEVVGTSCPGNPSPPDVTEGTVHPELLGAPCKSDADCSSVQNCCELGAAMSLGAHCINFGDQANVVTCPPGMLLGSGTGGGSVTGLVCSY